MLRPVEGLENDPHPHLDPEALVHLGIGSYANIAGSLPVDTIVVSAPEGPALSGGAGCGGQKVGYLVPPSPHWTLVGPRKARTMDTREGRSMLIWGVPRDIDAKKVQYALLDRTQVDSCTWRGQGQYRHVHLTLMSIFQMDALYRTAVLAGRRYRWRVAKGRSWAKRAEHRANSRKGKYTTTYTL